MIKWVIKDKRSFLLVLLYKYQIKYVMFAPELPFLFFCI